MTDDKRQYVIVTPSLHPGNVELDQMYGTHRRRSFVYLSDQQRAGIKVQDRYTTREMAQADLDALHGSDMQYIVLPMYIGHECIACRQFEDCAGYSADVRKSMIEHQLCFACNFWHEWSERRKELPWYGSLVIENQHYSVRCPGIREYGLSYGYGGRHFYIRALDSDDMVATNDLWHQGDIPDHWRDEFPDNAEFITKEHYDG